MGALRGAKRRNALDTNLIAARPRDASRFVGHIFLTFAEAIPTRVHLHTTSDDAAVVSWREVQLGIGCDGAERHLLCGTIVGQATATIMFSLEPASPSLSFDLGLEGSCAWRATLTSDLGRPFVSELADRRHEAPTRFVPTTRRTPSRRRQGRFRLLV